MKKVTSLITFIALAGMMYAQCDVQGNYRVTALDVQYYDVARQTTDVKVRDIYGLGGTGCDNPDPVTGACYVWLTLQTIQAGDIFYGTHSGPYNSSVLDMIGVNLNVNFNSDCTASLAAGSYYPDVNEENCVSSVQVLPITDDMLFTSDQSPAGQSPLPYTNLIGLESISDRAYGPDSLMMTGDEGTYGGLSLGEALIFDYFPQGTMGYLNQYGPDFTPFTGDELAPVSIPTQVNYPSTHPVFGDSLPANINLPGIHGGWIQIGDVGASQIGGEIISLTNPATGEPFDFYVDYNATEPDGFAEWHAIDGTASESGLGDFIGADEDGYDGDFDRTFGLPVVPTATYISDNCSDAVLPSGLGGTPIAGDITDALYGGVYLQAFPLCDAAGGPVEATTGLCYDASQSTDFAAACGAYGADAALVATCLELGFDEATCGEAASAAAPAIDAYCLYETGFDCATAGIDPCTVLTNPVFAQGLCGTLAGALTVSTSCEEWADGLATTASSDCVASVAPATEMWVMDPTGASAPWGNFATFNAAAYGQYAEGFMAQCLSTDAGEAACGAALAADPTALYLLTDDSGSEFDPTCLYDGDTSDCSGRLKFKFEPTCIPEIEVRQVVIEFNELGGTCANNGDSNEDGTVNVLDVVGTVNHILGNSSLTDGGACNADSNADGILNILDVVLTVNTILGNTRASSASSIEIIKSTEGVTFNADGYVGGIQMTINHGDDFSIEMTDKAMVAEYNVSANSTTLMIIDPRSDELFSSEGTYTIESVVAATNGEYVEVSIPTTYSVSNAYPNPFNPTTSIDIELSADANVSVKVFNIMGQLVDVVTEGQMKQGTHAVSWDASKVASGVYFINTEVGTNLNSQRVMLLK